MNENQKYPHSGDINSQEEEQERFSEESYLIDTINQIPEEILSDETYERNRSLIKNMTDNFCDRHNRHGDMPPAIAARCLIVFFSSITKFGLR